ncbi:hypothetical protein GIB67_015237 [Kingdonia uniflora]|uniref:Uncharacterized protein n=1 Tax=Kingdonia uniflora TaxID=39325 RepID=A0A7J7MSM6_9MAGN|nr:hypothetical protein GIB67_015237 [Kingdonia uniflora]
MKTTLKLEEGKVGKEQPVKVEKADTLAEAPGTTVKESSSVKVAAHNLEITRFGVDEVEYDVDCSRSSSNRWTFSSMDGFSRFMPFRHYPFQVDITINLGDHILQGRGLVEEELLLAL